MKTKMILISALLICLTTVSFAISPKKRALKSESISIETAIHNEHLAPPIYFTATFNDGTDMISDAGINITKLAPATPKIAEFEEDAIENVDIEKIAPRPPAEPEFEDFPGTTSDEIVPIAPKLPVVADFND